MGFGKEGKNPLATRGFLLYIQIIFYWKTEKKAVLLNICGTQIISINDDLATQFH
ncbi:unknown protein [Desulfotalea psychrophila LSv54]|uniref:Uncharacterized protein n=1 Tax=Desulfotalea psychrophila (strain LSv54 / DSM 12343) TaxID=177439 RepID=Q6ARY4_DESPS|nr:unknown protein [Desulfotalea psychrophila LSv54]